MATYKGVEIADHLEGSIAHMREVTAYGEELATLGQHWDLLSILGQMSGGAADMAGTREGFQRLTAELLTQLGTETLKKSVQQITSKATVAVDIVIRNLFERTADIGFLATDDDIRAFLRDGGDNAALVSRFKEYVAKYSVYHDIVLLNPAGDVLARIDGNCPVAASSDPLIAEALTTTAAYVEVFRHVDLLPGHATSLVYAYRVTESNDPRSRAIGVLCLCFRFENELEGVFGNLAEEGDWSILTLLDRDGRVIATSDAQQVPLGATMPRVLDEPYRIIRFAGREYLAKTCATQGYQGYMGPGWYGHVLAPLEHAFDRNAGQRAGAIEAEVLDAVTRNQQLFDPALQRIPIDAEAVQQQLDRAVWNGNILRDGHHGSEAAVKVLLWEISKTGGRTKNVFERSIGNLHETVVSSLLTDAAFLASLAIDIMDRNLYERANDCRWWALTSSFQQRLAGEGGSGEDTKIAAILSYINGLYTVYSNLFVFGGDGVIRAVSQPAYQHLVGTEVSEPWVQATLSLTSSQQYAVSAFAPTALYDGLPTYIYAAAIASPDAGTRPVGGIGIVFDGRPQFEAMLRDALPRAGGAVVAGAFGLFVDERGRVIATTTETVNVGETVDLDAGLAGLKPGQRLSRIVEWRGQYYVIGARSSRGYREYKGEGDSYRNAVISVIAVPLGESASAVNRRRKRAATVTVRGQRHDSEVVELATFYVGSHWLGVRSTTVVAALGVSRVTAVPIANPAVAGVAIFRDKPIPVLRLEAAADHLAGPQRETQVVVFNTTMGHVGLIVDELSEIPEVAMERIDPIRTIVGDDSYIEGAVRPAQDDRWPGLLLVINATRLCASLMGTECADDFFGQLRAVERAAHDAAA